MICTTCLKESEQGETRKTVSGSSFFFCPKHPPRQDKTCELCGILIPFGEEVSVANHTACMICCLKRPAPDWATKG